MPVPPVGATPVTPLPVPSPPVAPTRGGRVPSPRDSPEAVGDDTPAQAGTAAEPGTTAATGETAEKVVVAGTTVDHLTETYQAHYRSLLGLAALLLDDTASCEDVVQEAFIRVHSARNRVRDRDKTLA
ncbi:sigma factor, partial [Streptomyces goshikiensis]